MDIKAYWETCFIETGLTSQKHIGQIETTLKSRLSLSFKADHIQSYVNEIKELRTIKHE